MDSMKARISPPLNQARLYCPALFIALFLPLSVSQAIETDEEAWRIVNYWSEWCAPCRVEIPMLNSLRERLKSSNIRIVGINFDDDPREVTLDIAKEMGIEFPVLSQQEVEKLGLRPPDVLPTTYILSPSGEVTAKLIGMQGEQDILKELASQGLVEETQP